jgi:hypothetical protein
MLKYAHDVAMRDVEIRWEEPHATTWRSAFVVDQAQILLFNEVRMDAAPGSEHPVLRLNNADGVTVRESIVPSLEVTGPWSKAVRLVGTDAKVTADPGLPPVITK